MVGGKEIIEGVDPWRPRGIILHDKLIKLLAIVISFDLLARESPDQKCILND